MPAAQIDLAKGHTFAGAKPGSGKNFAKLKGALAKRGARNPGALAAYIGRRKYGKAGFAKLAHAHSNPMEFAMPTVQPVTSPWDIVVSRGDGNVIIRHRNGGAEIGSLARTEQGTWVATVSGKELAPRTHQRTALADVIGTHNKGALTERHKPASAGEPLQPAARQTPLMAAYGIPAVRALATPSAGSSDGPRTTDSDNDDLGLSAKGRAIHKRLKARGFPHERALAFAKRAQNMSAGK